VIRQFYDRVLLPRLCDLLLRQARIMQERRSLLESAGGRILEIGLGTGLNLPCYPRHVRAITTVDTNAGMHVLARRRIPQSGIRVEHHLASAEQLPFGDQTFDCVFSTFTLCSVDEVAQAIGEARRVLKPGGRVLFLEHGASPDLSVRRWQRRLNPLQMRLGGGCRLDRDFARLFAPPRFVHVEIAETDLAGVPRTHGHLYRGVAVK
jgi:ubiquinone/menaquinone biosynthesis C-methylase UbiE